MSRDTDLFAELMLALTSHLRPAPYQYGILTLRLLGKLGGKNRLFLGEPMNMTPLKKCNGDLRFNLNCGWESSSTFKIMLPIERSVAVLELMSALECDNTQKKPMAGENVKKDKEVLSEDLIVEQFDLSAYKESIVDESIQNQSRSAFVILRVALSTILNERNSALISDKQEFQEESGLSLRLFLQQNSHSSTKTLKLICRGLFYATNVSCVHSEALSLINGLAFQMINFVALSLKDISRSNDSEVVAKEQGKSGEINSSQKQAKVVGGKLQPLLPFGCFTFSGHMKTRRYCLVLNEVIPEVLKSGNSDEIRLALATVKKVVDCTKVCDEDRRATEESKSMLQLSCTDIFVENMLHHFCHTCLAAEWQERSGIYDGITYLLKLMGKEWSSKFEVELIHVAIFCIKDHPQEVAVADKEALSFFFKILSTMYSTLADNDSLEKIYDNVCVLGQKESKSEARQEKRILNNKKVSEAICSIMIGELGSSNSAVR